jgi:hypothetical protein
VARTARRVFIAAARWLVGESASRNSDLLLGDDGSMTTERPANISVVGSMLAPEFCLQDAVAALIHFLSHASANP